MNEREFDYREGNVFLLPPRDYHFFKVMEPSCFYFVWFIDHYFFKGRCTARLQSVV
ncbi:hypothetical protein [Persicobacter sp. CCB-QB2]|uniref:hypothetical protein n=1 Tax=Persicobacter sp. CCB-QB2 TaxID=1561025 RepID=UPI001C113BE8